MPKPRQGSRGRVLLVEDNVLNQVMAVGILSKLGHAADVVAGGPAPPGAARRTACPARPTSQGRTRCRLRGLRSTKTTGSLTAIRSDVTVMRKPGQVGVARVADHGPVR
jgi:CheY-like chemotaxis protein